MKFFKRKIAPLITVLTVLNTHALEPLKDSTDVLMEVKAKQALKKADTNKDGKIQKDEDEKNWRKNARYDVNKDGALDLGELKQIPGQYIDSPGEKLLNVLFKRTPQGPVFFDFYFPDKDNASNKPVLIFTHGGGWAAGDKSKAGVRSFNEIHRELLKKGFCVLSVGYRLTGDDSTMRDCVIDAQDALRFISAYRKELGIDPNRIYTFGDSAGGHLAQMVLFAPPDRLKGDAELAKYSYKTVAGVSWYGPCDFQDPELFNGSTRFNGRIMGKDTEDKEARFREVSPVVYLTKNSPPLLMFQGDKDTTIPVKHAYRMQETLKTIDAPVEIVIVKNSGHNFRPVDGIVTPSKEEIVEQTVQFFVDRY